jgi:hypothetical protein
VLFNDTPKQLYSTVLSVASCMYRLTAVYTDILEVEIYCIPYCLVYLLGPLPPQQRSVIVKAYV